MWYPLFSLFHLNVMFKNNWLRRCGGSFSDVSGQVCCIVYCTWDFHSGVSISSEIHRVYSRESQSTFPRNKLLASCVMLFLCLAYSSTLKVGMIRFSETSVDSLDYTTLCSRTENSYLHYIVCVQGLWGYVVPWVDSFTEDRACVLREASGMQILAELCCT
jgi:hypothetical protein